MNKCFGLLFLLFLPLVSSVTVTPGVLFVSSSNGTVNFTENMSFDSAVIGSGVVLNFDLSPVGNFSANFSGVDVVYQVESAPSLVRVNDFQYRLYDNFGYAVNGTVGLFNVPCEGRAFSINGVEYGAGSSECVNFDYFLSPYVVFDVGLNNLLLSIADLPVASVDVVDVGIGFGSTSVNVSLSCYHGVESSVDYELYFNGVLLQSGVMSVGDYVFNVSVPLDGDNWVYGVCSNSYGVGVVNSSFVIANRVFSLWDEVENDFLDLDTVDSAVVYFDDSNVSFDFKSAGVYNVSFVGVDNKLRFVLGYDSGDIITRYFDTDVRFGDVRVCANHENVTHYENLIVSGGVRPVVVRNVFADCIVGADYTRFVYQDSNILKIFTIDANYEISLVEDGVQVFLAGVDGSIASYYNIDVLEFNAQTYDLGVNTQSLSISKFDANTVKIYYINPKGNNDDVSLSIVRMDTNEEVYFNEVFADDDEFIVYFDFTTLTNITNSTLFMAVVVYEVAGVEGSIVKYFDVDASGGLIPSGVGVVIAVLLTIVGLTFTISRTSFSWFGVIVQLLAIGVLSFSVVVWYVTFTIVLEVIVLVWVVILMTQQNYATLT